MWEWSDLHGGTCPPGLCQRAGRPRGPPGPCLNSQTRLIEGLLQQKPVSCCFGKGSGQGAAPATRDRAGSTGSAPSRCRGTTSSEVGRTERGSDKQSICCLCGTESQFGAEQTYRKAQSLLQETLCVQVFYKIRILGCYYHSFQGIREEKKKKSAIALDGILIFKLTRAKPQAMTQKSQASLSHSTPPVTQHALHCAKQHSSRHWSSCLSI